MARKRKKGEGAVIHRKDGRWEGRMVIGYDEDGRPKTKNVLARAKAECLTKLQMLKETCGDLTPTRISPVMTFGDWLDHWYQSYSKPTLRQTT